MVLSKVGDVCGCRMLLKMSEWRLPYGIHVESQLKQLVMVENVSTIENEGWFCHGLVNSCIIKGSV